MPCWTVDTISVDFQAKYIDLILEAARSIGLTPYVEGQTILMNDLLYIDLNNQTAKVADNDYRTLNKLKRAYSKAVIETVAKKKRWAVQTTGANKMRLRRY